MEEKPELLIGSPMCTMFSALQTLSGWNQEKQERWVEAVDHINFVIELYTLLMKEGRSFLHEHPAGASSWALEKMVKLGQQESVVTVKADQCMYGLYTKGKNGKE